MSHKHLSVVVPALLLLAACSRNNPPAVARNVNPEPVDRTAATSPAGSPAQFAQRQEPAGMYSSGQAVTGDPYSAPPQPTQATSPYQPPQAMANPVDTPEPVATPSAATAPSSSQIASENATPGRPTPSWDQPVLPTGTILRVRLDETLATKYDRTGMRFYATLSAPVTSNDRVVLPAGTRFVGHLIESKPSGHLKGRAILAVRLDAIEWNGRDVPIDSSSIVRATRGRKHHDFSWIGGGSGFGAVIGAIAGGGGGAIIGAAAGAGAGTAGALVTHKKQLYIPAESALLFRLRRPAQL